MTINPAKKKKDKLEWPVYGPRKPHESCENTEMFGEIILTIFFNESLLLLATAS